jgi:hypothetical protein
MRAMVRFLAMIALVVAASQQVARGDCGKSAQSRAKHAADDGTAMYRAGNLAGAAEAYKKAQDACPDPNYLFNLGQIYRKLGDNAQAVSFYKQYMADAAPDEARRADAQKWIAQLQPPTAAPAAEPTPPTPAPAAATAPTPPPVEEPVEIGRHSIGMRARYIFVTKVMLSPYFNANTGTQLNSFSVGLEYVWRGPGKHYDVVTSLDFSWLPVDDGNFLGSGHDPSLDTHYTQFHNLSFVSADVSIIGWHKFLPWLELRYGGGLGIGWVPGEVLLTNNGPMCTTQNANDTTQCYPLITGPINGKPTPAQEQQLKASEGGGTDTNTTPHRHPSADKPPVMGVVNLLVGLRFYVAKRMTLTWEIGFRDAMFTGFGLHYLF